MLQHAVRSDFGAKVGTLAAQHLVAAPHRESGQAQFISRPMREAHAKTAGGIARLLNWLRANPGAPHTIASMATQANLSHGKFFLRVFSYCIN